VPPLKGLKNVLTIVTQGLRPGLCRSIAPLGLFDNNSKKETAQRSQKGQVKLIPWWGFAECGNRQALRLKAQGVYSCKLPSLNVDHNAASAVLCNALKK